MAAEKPGLNQNDPNPLSGGPRRSFMETARIETIPRRDAMLTSNLPEQNVSASAVIGDIISRRAGEATPQISVNDMFSYTPVMSESQKRIYDEMDAYKRAPATGALSPDTYFPGNGRIEQGEYAGPTIGKVTLVSPGGGRFPYGIADAREKALQDAAMAKNKQIEDFTKMLKPPETKHTAVKPQLDELYWSGNEKWIANAQKIYGDNWASALMNDPGYNKWKDSMNTVAETHDGMVDYIAGLEDKAKTGKFVMSPELKSSISDFNQGIKGLENPFDPKGHELNNTLARMRVEANLDEVVNDATQHIIRSVEESNPHVDKKGIYDIISTQKVTEVSPERIKALAGDIMRTHYNESSMFTQEQVEQRLSTALQKQSETQFQTHANQFAPTGGSGKQEVKYSMGDITANTKGNVNIPYVERDNKGKELLDAKGQPLVKYETLPFTFAHYVGHKQEDKASITAGPDVMDIATGSPVKFVGSQPVTVMETGVLPFWRKGTKNIDKKDIGGTIITDKRMEELKNTPNGDKLIDWQTASIATYKENNLIPRTIVFPTKRIYASLKSKGATGEALDGLVDYMDQQARQLNTTAPAAPATKQVPGAQPPAPPKQTDLRKKYNY